MTGARNVEKKSDRTLLFLLQSRCGLRHTYFRKLRGAWFRGASRSQNPWGRCGRLGRDGEHSPPPGRPSRSGTYSPSRLASRAVTKALTRDRLLEAGHRFSSPSPRTVNRRGWLMGEGIRSRRPRVSFARACGRRGLGDPERRRRPLPVFARAGERRRMLERTADQGSGDAPCPWSADARPRPRCAGCRARSAAVVVREDVGCTYDEDWGSRLRP